MKHILLYLFFFGGFHLLPTNDSYRIQYRLTYHPDSTNLQRKNQETFLLFIKPNQASYFSAVNVLKKDSIDVLISQGKLSGMDVVSDPKLRFKTRFPQFIVKDYTKSEIDFYEILDGVHPKTYKTSTKLNWNIENQQDTITGYACTKATTQYRGRTWEAWFAPEIPFSDGPYIFQGLPGLIVKLNDTRHHYEYTLEQFGKYTGPVTEKLTYRKWLPTTVLPQKLFEMRNLYRTDPLEAAAIYENFDLRNHKAYVNGIAKPMRETLPDRSWDNNPLELKMK